MDQGRMARKVSCLCVRTGLSIKLPATGFLAWRCRGLLDDDGRGFTQSIVKDPPEGGTIPGGYRMFVGGESRAFEYVDLADLVGHAERPCLIDPFVHGDPGLDPRSPDVGRDPYEIQYTLALHDGSRGTDGGAHRGHDRDNAGEEPSVEAEP